MPDYDVSALFLVKYSCGHENAIDGTVSTFSGLVNDMKHRIEVVAPPCFVCARAAPSIRATLFVPPVEGWGNKQIKSYISKDYLYENGDIFEAREKFVEKAGGWEMFREYMAAFEEAVRADERRGVDRDD